MKNTSGLQRAEDRQKHRERNQQADVLRADAPDKAALHRTLSCRSTVRQAGHLGPAPVLWSLMARSRIAFSVVRSPSSSSHDAAGSHHQDAVRQAYQFSHLGRDQEDRHAVGGKALDEAVDLGLGADVDAAGRLVQDQDLRLAGDPAGEDNLLLVAARQLADRLLQRWRLDAKAFDKPPDEGALSSGVGRSRTGTPSPAP